jgi:hypothetical protein
VLQQRVPELRVPTDEPFDVSAILVREYVEGLVKKYG